MNFGASIFVRVLVLVMSQDDRHVRALISLCSGPNCFYRRSPASGYGVLDKQKNVELEKISILEL